MTETYAIAGYCRISVDEELDRDNTSIENQKAIIQGVDCLTGASVKAWDLRAGAAMVIAGLCAQGTTEVEGVDYIERGYVDLVGKLKKVGADIESVDVPAEDEEQEIIRIG